MTFESWFQVAHSTISTRSADAVLRLTAEGATLPFIARYRKEQTGNLDEVAIQTVIDAKETWDKVLQRQAHIVQEIEVQKKLTPELKEKILACFDLEILEDIYLPYKQKRKTKAGLAREAGLERLAEWLWNCGHGTEKAQPGQTLELWAFTFKNEEKGILDSTKAIEGAQDILIERLSEKQELRQLVRTRYFEKGALTTGKGPKAKPNSKFENYFEFNETVSSLKQPQATHRYLAIRRGWTEQELSLNIGGTPTDTEFERELLHAFEGEACSVPDFEGAAVLLKAAKMSLKAYVIPSIENEVHKMLREIADETAISVFAENVRTLLLASPYGPKAVLGVDPGIRTGCKIAVVDDSGKYIASTVIHLQSESEKAKATALVTNVVGTGNIRAIAVGNGTAGRETEVFLRAVMKSAGLSIPVVMVSESGASVYSASDVAREEFPELDLTIRGAISIARRLQDPLAELVKVDPKSIGVGQYQHDVSPHALKKSLDRVVDSCVNSVGVNLNTASYHLLSHVSGIGPSLAKGIVAFRDKQGLFKSRTTLLDVPRLSGKAYEQCAGFLRIPEASDPLDNTGVHPERYTVLEKSAVRLGKSVRELLGSGAQLLKKDSALLDEVGEFTLKDIVAELSKPGRDPREEFVAFQFRDDIHELKDLELGMMCPGIVTNVTNFGAFVDIGVHQDGLVHISQLSDRFVKDPREAVNPGDRVQVRVLEVNLEKTQIALSMKGLEKGGEKHKSDRERAPRRPSEKHAGASTNLKPSGAPSPISPVGAGHHARPGSAPSMQSRPAKPVAPKQAFNNPFAALASLKKELPRR